MPIALTHLESTASGEFIELQADAGRLRVRFGAIGLPCLVLHATFKAAEKARTNHDRLRDEWLARGYVACAPTVEVTDGSVADELFCDEREAHPLLEPFLRILDDTWLSLRGQAKRVALFRRGLRWQGDLDLERIAELGLHVGVVVDGDVEVSGVFSQLTYTYPGCILVSGDVRATSFGHGDSHMHVLGDVRVDHIVYGEYNDGSLRIAGSVHGRAFICSGHDMHAEGDYHLPVCDWDMDENWSDCLHPDLFECDGDDDEPGRTLSGTAIRAFMHAGRDPFRPGAQPKLREPQQSAPPTSPAPMSAFAQALRACVLAEDTEAITHLLETWPEHDEEWQAAVTGRLCAPSTTSQQRARLLALQQRG
jgi:hypothetical protein